MTAGDQRADDGWERHRIDQLRRTSEATPLQRLRWLEEAIDLAFRVGALPRFDPQAEPTHTRRSSHT